MIGTLLFAIIFFVFNFVLLGVTLYGIYLSFIKKWYIGLAALVFPAFGFVIGAAKLIFKKDLLK